ncbi:1-phosphofructokinase [Paenisporosarcina sp. TG20]|uniref:1-phosphofructokinase n=1 Tax=Paenisporosarcina sp. TG20 TaxID=1211706 RepID=UPI0003146C86|nr:1-phosphofructokinase [Paenisporosarcina sp. TG20]
MIYTCTFTPSLDYTTFLSDFKTGQLNRSNEVFYYPGGKGINVSRVLKRLGVNNIALGFAGGFTGNYIEQFLMKEGIHTDFIQTDEITRINVKIKASEETELNGPGPVINTQQQNVLLDKIKTMKQGDWFVLAGSLPESIPDTFFMEIASTCNDKDVHFVLDTSGPALKKLVLKKPFLIKPNEHELGELFETIITTKEEACHYAKKLVDIGVQNVVVSMGKEGALLVTKNLVVSAEVPKGKVVNTVGAGDSLVSGFIASFIKNQDVIMAFRYGVASGSATAFQSDLCEKSDVEALVEQVIIHPIHEQDVTK